MAIATLKERQEGFRKDILRQKDVIAGARRDRAQQAVELETLEETLKSLEDKVREKLQMKEKNRDYLKGLKDKRTREYQENDELTEFIMAESIKEARLNEAHRMLSDEESNVSTVAYGVGFSPAHFSIAFRKRYGVSPRRNPVNHGTVSLNRMKRPVYLKP